MTWNKFITLLDYADGKIILPAVFACGLFAASHALLKKKDPRAALLWVSITLLLPVIGPLTYWLLGVNRITRRALQWKSNKGDVPEVLCPQQLASTLLPVPYNSLLAIEVLSSKVTRLGITGGNSIEAYHNGETAYPAMLAAINNAQYTVHLCSYIFDGDGAGSKFIVALTNAAARGVKVRVIVDAMGERYSKHTARKALKDSDVDIRHYLPLHKAPFINLRNHRKLLVTDGLTAFTGGMNIRTNHCLQMAPPGKATSDIHFSIKGPAVADLQRIFLEDWYFISEQIPEGAGLFPDNDFAGSAFVRAIADGPDSEIRKLETLLHGAMDSARRRIRIMTPYFVPDRPMITALITAALRGTEIQIVLPAKNNLPFVAWASRASYWELLAHDIHIYEQPAPFAHTKLVVVDDLWCLIGSANWDTRSLRLNFELNLSVFDRKLATNLSNHFDETIAASKQITLTEADGRSLPVRLRDSAARLFSPYL
ncbi:MAG: cardiolipin synthase [Trichlorobacter sp.]|nr:cardiolipin synthase [Trichlorobacter sp.]